MAEKKEEHEIVQELIRVAGQDQCAPHLVTARLHRAIIVHLVTCGLDIHTALTRFEELCRDARRKSRQH